MRFPKPKDAVNLIKGIEKIIMEHGIIINHNEQDDHKSSNEMANCMWDKMLRGLLNKQSFENKFYRENLKRILLLR